jgi:hypothetical protein
MHRVVAEDDDPFPPSGQARAHRRDDPSLFLSGLEIGVTNVVDTFELTKRSGIQASGVWSDPPLHPSRSRVMAAAQMIGVGDVADTGRSVP